MEFKKLENKMKIFAIAISLLLGLASQSANAACANNKPFCACNQSGDICVGCLNSGGFWCNLRLKNKIYNTQETATATPKIGAMSAQSTAVSTETTMTKEIKIQNCNDLGKSGDFNKLEKQQKRDVMRFCQKQFKAAKKQLIQKPENKPVILKRPGWQ